MSQRLDVDSIINQMINSGGRNVKIREKDISLLCKLTREIFMEQPVFLELEAPIKICGKYPIKRFQQAFPVKVATCVTWRGQVWPGWAPNLKSAKMCHAEEMLIKIQMLTLHLIALT